jgi:hypothetical protein
MCKQLAYSVCVVLLLCAAVDVQAVEVYWTGAGPDQLWSTRDNWNPKVLPTAKDPMFVDGPDGTHCVIAAGVDAHCETLRVANSGNTTNLDITGGTFTVHGGCYIGVDNPNGHGILNVSGGLFKSPDMNLGLRGTGTLNLTGGIVELGWDLKIPGNSGTGKANLMGGTLKALNLDLTSELGSMDITAGTMILDGDDIDTLQGYIDDGRLTAYGGQGTVHMDFDVTTPGQTTVTASHPLNPVPADGGLVSPGTVTLTWTLPDPCVPGQPVPVDVYFTDDLQSLKDFIDPAAIRVVDHQNLTAFVVQTQVKTRYYWAVDTYIGDPNDPIWGPIFSFLVDNKAPQVDAGADVVTYLEEGVRVGDIAGMVTDDGAIQPYTVQWTVVSEPDDPNTPGAVISDPGAEATTITLSALGTYVLELEANDGEYKGADTMTINVYADSCAAARALPGYEPLVGDLNGDCRVDELDEALMMENWLKDISLEEAWLWLE